LQDASGALQNLQRFLKHRAFDEWSVITTGFDGRITLVNRPLSIYY